MHAVIFAGGTLQPGEAVTTAIAAADIIIAADSGAAIALRYDCMPAIMVGDFDSLDALRLQQLKEQGAVSYRLQRRKMRPILSLPFRWPSRKAPVRLRCSGGWVARALITA